MLTAVLPILQAILAFGNICVLAYTFKTFLNKPQTTLEEKLKDHETRLKNLEELSNDDRENFKGQEETNEVLIRALFALLEYEVHYCEMTQRPISRNLERAKDGLHEFLTKKGGIYG